MISTVEQHLQAEGQALGGPHGSTSSPWSYCNAPCRAGSTAATDSLRRGPLKGPISFVSIPGGGSALTPQRSLLTPPASLFPLAWAARVVRPLAIWSAHQARGVFKRGEAPLFLLLNLRTQARWVGDGWWGGCCGLGIWLVPIPCGSWGWLLLCSPPRDVRQRLGFKLTLASGEH